MNVNFQDSEVDNDSFMLHKAPTRGSSGSPIFNSAFTHIVGLHKSGTHLTAHPNCNRGIIASRILRWVMVASSSTSQLIESLRSEKVQLIGSSASHIKDLFDERIPGTALLPLDCRAVPLQAFTSCACRSLQLAESRHWWRQ